MTVTIICLKGHSQPWNRADLDTNFLTLKRIPINLKSKCVWNSASIFVVFLLDFQSFNENLFLSVFFSSCNVVFIIFG